MLYLNDYTAFQHLHILNLTLTNVVFEFDKKFRISAGFDYLTLTNVVFEYNYFTLCYNFYKI